ncbi:hypothetical protein, partial [uncultured Duncaniella sp.]
DSPFYGLADSKKIIMIVALVMSLSGAMCMDAFGANVSSETMAAASAQSVRIYSYISSNMKHSNSATVEVTDNAVYVTYHGETYTARYSNRKGYDYMFTDKKGKIWYFSV